MTGRQRELYLRLRRRAGRLRARVARRPAEETADVEVAPAPPPIGRAPDVARETTHLGPMMDDAVFRAKRRMRIGVDPDYDLLYENFDVLHYLLQSPHLLNRPEVDLIEHFLEHGLAERLSPHPDFSMAEYVRRYPRKATAGRERSPYLAWLKQGRAAGELADPAPGVGGMAHVLGLRPQQVVELVADRRQDLQQRLRTGRLGEVFGRAAEVEPLIGAAWTEAARPRLLPLSRPVVVGEVAAIYRAQEAAGFRRARLVLVVGRAGRTGGRRMEAKLVNAVADHIDPAEVVVICTDDGAETQRGQYYPEGIREIDFAKTARGLQAESAQHALVMLLRTFHADAIVNVDSPVLYQAMQAYGRALAVTERLFLVLSETEGTTTGTWEGSNLRYFYRTFDDVVGVITDSEPLADALGRTYRMSEKDRERLHVLRPPVGPDSPLTAASPTWKAFATRTAELLLTGAKSWDGGR